MLSFNSDCSLGGHGSWWQATEFLAKKVSFLYLYFLIRYFLLSMLYFSLQSNFHQHSFWWSFFFLNYRYSSLRLVPAYNKFIQERFERCLDLYLCPRQRKMRVSLIKKHKGIHLLLGLFCNLFSSLDYATVRDSKNLQRFMEAMLKWRLSVLGIKLQWWVPQSHLPFQSDDLL